MSDPQQNPYAGTSESFDAESSALETSVPSVFGTLNIVFGAVLVLCGGCYAVQIFSTTLFGPMMQAQMKAAEEQRQKQIDDLKDLASKAETEEEAEGFQETVDKLEAAPMPPMPDISNIYGMKSPGVMATYVADVTSALLLNLLLLISGVGLVGYHEWGRKLGVWVAGLKLLRLVVICLLTVLLVAPAVGEGMGGMIEDAMKNAPPGAQAPPAGQMKMVYSMMVTGWGVTLLVLGSIYPLLALWKLTRPYVIAACRQKDRQRDRERFV